jgi:hypothetical protein
MFAGLDMFSLRMEYCEEKVKNCLADHGKYEELLDHTIGEDLYYDGRFAKCKSVFNACLEDHHTKQN